MKPVWLFRVDGGKVSGLSMGHVFRCLALAEDICSEGIAEPRFLMKDIQGGPDLVRKCGYRLDLLPANALPIDELEMIEKAPCDVIVVDYPAWRKLPISAIKGKLRVVIDDIGGGEAQGDILVNGSIAAESLQYTQSGNMARLLLGPSFAILGREFDGMCERSAVATARGVLVSFGGSDPSGLTEKAIVALKNKEIEGPIRVVVGPAYGGEGLEQLRRIAGFNFEILCNLPSLAKAMIQADVVIIAGGRTAYEAAALGIPSIIIPSIAHEVSVAKAFEAAGVSLASTVERLGTDLELLLRDGSRRVEMQAKARHLIDGKGRRRLIDAILGDRRPALS